MDLSGLPARMTPDREYYGAIVDLLCEQTRILAGLAALIAERIPPRPAPGDGAGAGESQDGEGVSTREPATAPPRDSGRAQWAAYALAGGVTVRKADSRDRIIAACRRAGIQT
jgi:hypothetical protein